jgi:hypothetical protein
MEVRNMDLTSVTDNIDYLQSWWEQWCFSEEYADYNAEETELFAVGNMLFLIPKEEKLTKPIRIIIA